jgi:hypothetical protein
VTATYSIAVEIPASVKLADLIIFYAPGNWHDRGCKECSSSGKHRAEPKQRFSEYTATLVL